MADSAEERKEDDSDLAREFWEHKIRRAEELRRCDARRELEPLRELELLLDPFSPTWDREAFYAHQLSYWDHAFAERASRELWALEAAEQLAREAPGMRDDAEWSELCIP